MPTRCQLSYAAFALGGVVLWETWSGRRGGEGEGDDVKPDYVFDRRVLE